ncbi:MAG: ATP-binding protein [Synechococcales bacterium]|nr:ATP-binding protein [Synechococcales bacterium]
MTSSIDQILRKAVNPFDPATFKPGNFWHERHDPQLEVDSIHREAIAQVESVLEQVGQDHRTRTLLLYGDSGSGKSYLLGRLKRVLNQKAFFAYIDPFPDSEAIWRHVLRYTVDSLLNVPEGKADSQLLLWLKSLSIFRQWDITQWVLLTERQRFVRKLKSEYPSGIYNATEFFGVLYDLLDPERYTLASEWLRGDDLDEESLELLKVKQSIETEDAAQKILANFGRIAAETQPIVLCFDQLDNIARTSDGSIDLQALFNVNSCIHNQGLKSFFVIISIITNTLRQNADRVQPADRARIDAEVALKPISLDQARELWASRLMPFHQQASPAPDSPIYPLAADALEQKFPGGKTHPRNALELGRRLLQTYKLGRADEDSIWTQIERESVDAQAPAKPSGEGKEDAIAAFRLVWRKEFNAVAKRITRIRQLASPELIQMLKEALAALTVEGIRPRLLPSQTYGSHSFSYDGGKKVGRIGVAWNEDPNMTTFYHVMNACQRTVNLGLCQTLYLIRGEGIGKPGRKGYEIYQGIFADGAHTRIRPDLASVHGLATYHSLVNAAYAGELVVAGQVVGIEDLENLTRQSGVLEDLRVLQDLRLVTGRSHPKSQKSPKSSKPQPDPDLQPVQEFLLDLVKTHQLLGLQIMLQTAQGQFPGLTAVQISQAIDNLCQANQIQIIDPSARPDEQLVCYQLP